MWQGSQTRESNIRETISYHKEPLFSQAQSFQDLQLYSVWKLLQTHNCKGKQYWLQPIVLGRFTDLQMICDRVENRKSMNSLGSGYTFF